MESHAARKSRPTALEKMHTYEEAEEETRLQYLIEMNYECINIQFHLLLYQASTLASISSKMRKKLLAWLLGQCIVDAFLNSNVVLIK
jgi:hypothetical protein